MFWQLKVKKIFEHYKLVNNLWSFISSKFQKGVRYLMYYISCTLYCTLTIKVKMYKSVKRYTIKNKTSSNHDL